ncbi:prepilin-type N-terminal cleavage/methylation domain-containing protein [Clostridium butyricum]|uniref:prepilin-type N-terminal cleavage/methylation domain-containing protein n=1 Tax=Clostridium butyricum TaxID=1492 RepID=UPI0005EACF1B|nr:prepilin-type N-terminal cleavage/methylation domain-containing protein [Clostridium butyricum]
MNQLVLKKKNELMKKKKGFTLVELIIVIAIIAILAVIAIPKFAEIRENANVKADISSAKAIQSAVAVAVTNDQSGFELSTTDTPNTVSVANLQSVINGGVIPTAKAKEVKGGTFSASIDKNGNVKVSATKDTTTLQILPTPVAPYN